MEAIRIHEIMAKDGEIAIRGLPYKKGQFIEIIVLPHVLGRNRNPPSLTVRRFRESGLIGMWKDREDIQDGLIYARKLRQEIQTRRYMDNDPGGL